MTGFEGPDDKITFEIESDAQRMYDLTIRYAGIYGEKYTSVVLNQGATEEILLRESESFEDAAGGQVLLEEGTNTIDIVSHWGW